MRRTNRSRRRSSFRDTTGENLDALVDCLGDVAELDYGWAENETGLVIVIDNFDHFHSAIPKVAVTVLDIISGAALRGDYWAIEFFA